MMIADITLEQFKDALNWGHQYVKENTIATCESVLYIVCVPVILGNGGCLVLPTKAICTAFQVAIYAILNALSIAAEIAYRALHYTYDYKVNQSICMPIAYQFCLSLSCIMPSLFATKNQTLGPAETLDGYEYSKAIYNRLTEVSDWNYEALQVINGNIGTQHTEMREDLQDRHQEMTTDIIEFLEIATNTLGNQFNLQNEWLDEILCQIYIQAGADSCEGDGESLLGMAIKWPENPTPVWEKFDKKLDEYMDSIQKSLAANGMKWDGVVTDRMLETEPEMNHLDSILKEVKDEMNVHQSKVESVEAKVDELSADIKQMKQMMSKITEALEQNTKTN